MPKELKCRTCGCYLGEIEKGKIRNGTTLQCKKCTELSNEIETIAKDMSKECRDSSVLSYDIPEFLKNLLDRKP